MARESTIQVYRSSVTDIATGLTFGELAYTDVNGRLFVGRTGGSALWIGAGITTGTIATNSTVLVPTQSAVKTYVDGVIGGGSVVNSVNGSAGAITVTGDGGSLLATVSGTTTTFSNRLASTTLTGVASFNSTRFTVSAAGAVDLASAFQVTGDTVVAGNAITATRSGNSVTIDNNGVRSFNGSTGAVNFAVPVASFTVTGAASFNRNDFTVGSTGHVGLTGTIARTNVINTFTASQSISAYQPYFLIEDTNTNNFFDIIPNTGMIRLGNAFYDQYLVFNGLSDSTVTLPDFTTTLAGLSGTQEFTGRKTFSSLASFSNGLSANGATFSGNISAPNIVNSVNGSTGAITIQGLTGITASVSGQTIRLSHVVTNDNTNNTRYLAFYGVTSGVDVAKVDENLRYNPLTNTISAYGGLVLNGLSSGGVATPNQIFLNDPNNGGISLNSSNYIVDIFSSGGAGDVSSIRLISYDGLDNGWKAKITPATLYSADRTFTLPDDSGIVALTKNVATSVNGATGAVTITGSGAILFAHSDKTGTFNARLASTSATGVASFNVADFVVGSTGHVGLTGTIARTNVNNQFSTSQTVIGDIIASQLQAGNDLPSGIVFVRNGDILHSTDSPGANQRLVFSPAGNSVITLPSGVSGTVALVGTTVATVNGQTGAVGITGSGAILFVQSGKTGTFDARLASASATGVASFGNQFVVSAAGAVSLTSNYISSVNGATGAITLTGAGGAILFTQSGAANTVNARTASTSLTGVASFNSASFDVSAGGDVTIKTAGVSNTQLANSSVTVAAGGNSTLSLGNTLTFTGGATPNIVFSNTANTVTATLANDIVIPGNLTVNGTVVTANVDSFIVEDPLFMLGTGNAADSVDLGFYAQYTSGGRRFAGFFRDASDGGKFKIFANLTGGAEPTTTVNDAASGYGIATIVANIDGGTF